MKRIERTFVAGNSKAFKAVVDVAEEGDPAFEQAIQTLANKARDNVKSASELVDGVLRVILHPVPRPIPRSLCDAEWLGGDIEHRCKRLKDHGGPCWWPGKMDDPRTEEEKA